MAGNSLPMYKDINIDIVTWQEVAVPGEGVIGTNVTIDNAHNRDLWTRAMNFTWFNLKRDCKK